MMAERPAPPWLVATIRFVQGNEGALGLWMVGTAAALFAMMAIGMLVAWQSGLI